MINEALRMNDLKRQILGTEGKLSADSFPELYNLSAGFIFEFIPIPTKAESPEYVYMEVPTPQVLERKDDIVNLQVAIAEWNMVWESAQMRQGLLEALHDNFPKDLNWIKKFENRNIYILPKTQRHRYYTFCPLFHLLPRSILKRFGLPFIKYGRWPFLPMSMRSEPIEKFIPPDFDQRLSKAFAHYIWPLIDTGSRIEAFSSTDSIKLLAHNLDFWVPNIFRVLENRLEKFGRVPVEGKKQENLLKKLHKERNPKFRYKRPLRGGAIWIGESEAWEAAKQLIETADSNGRLRDIIDAVRSNRVEDDFDQRWSYAKEDFERKLYKKRTKTKVKFVELKDTIPVHGPESEIFENLFFEDFIGLLNKKDRTIVILLRNGITRVGEISKMLGYANHSPVSKALTRIRQKALRFLE